MKPVRIVVEGPPPKFLWKRLSRALLIRIEHPSLVDTLIHHNRLVVYHGAGWCVHRNMQKLDGVLGPFETREEAWGVAVLPEIEALLAFALNGRGRV